MKHSATTHVAERARLHKGILFFSRDCRFLGKDDNRGMDELDRLEIKVSYLESQNAELNEVVIDQGKQIAHLMVQIEELKKKIKDLMDVTADERANRRPPHY